WADGSLMRGVGGRRVSVEPPSMRIRQGHRALLTFVVGAAMALGPALGAAQPPQSVQYRSPAGVEYRSQPDTDAIKAARAALAADPKNVARVVDLGVAQPGARQFREAIEPFPRGLAMDPNNARPRRGRGPGY